MDGNTGAAPERMAEERGAARRPREGGGAGSFELLLFSSDPALIAEAEAGGVAGVVVDWEREGKAQRQAHADTQIGADTLEDLRQARAGTRTRLLCRINGYGPWTAREVAQALDEGADELLVPMVRRPAEVEAVLDLAGGRCGEANDHRRRCVRPWLTSRGKLERMRIARAGEQIVVVQKTELHGTRTGAE